MSAPKLDPGLNPTEIYTAAVASFQIPARLRPEFSNYYILHWKPQYLISVFNEGTIIRDGIEYHVVNHIAADIVLWWSDPYVRLSFRKLPDLKYGFVLIRRMSQSTKPVKETTS